MSSTGKFKLLENSISELFKAKDKVMRYEIPLYQRKYTWDNEQIGPLLEDIVERNEDRSQHYMGIMATTKAELENVSGSHTETYIRIIDGQQRITTSILIIDVLEKMIREKNKDGYLGGFTDNFPKVSFRNEIKTNISEDIGNIVSKERSKILPKTTLIKKNINIIEDFFSNKNDILEGCLETFLTLFKVGRLQYVIERNEEMLVFENLNSKGSPLDEFDLIRNYIISLDQKNSNNAKAALMKFNEKILNILTSGTLMVKAAKVNTTFEKFMMFFLKWKGFSFSFKSYPLYKNFKLFIDNQTMDFDGLLELIRKYLILYLSLSNENGKFYNKLWIRVIKKVVHIPMAFELFNMYSSYDNNDDNGWEWNDKIDNYFKAFSIHVIKLLSVEGTGQSFQKLIEKINVKLVDGMTSSAMIKWLSQGENVSSGNTPSNERFERSLNMRQTQKWIPEAIIDIIEYYSYELNESINYNGRTLEHIMPQTPNKNVWGIDKTEEAHKEYINRIGNLAFLNGAKNSSAGNKSFVDKVTEYYMKSKSPLLVEKKLYGINVRNVVDYSEWNTKNIDKRTKELSKVIIKIMG